MDIALPRRGSVRRVPCHCVMPRCRYRGRADGVCAASLDHEPLERGLLKFCAVGARAAAGLRGAGRRRDCADRKGCASVQ
eukprot:10515675-Heterocapsa_arctica.AAC.1